MVTTDEPSRLEVLAFAALDRLCGDIAAVGIALSGGGDSVALMHLTAKWAAVTGRRIATATVDHGLRPESAAEAARAGKAAGALGLSHHVLRWDVGTEAGNLMANAREARLRLLSDWARGLDLPAIALGHTRDDVAETLLMRLSRGAGIDGLAAMSDRREAEGVIWLRPLLRIGRGELRDWLRMNNLNWTDDPSNENDRFERVRIRKAMAQIGLDPAALALSAENLADARNALNAAIMPLIDGVQAAWGSLSLDRDLFDAAATESRRRLLIAAIRHVTGAAYPPRRSGVDHALDAVVKGKRVTLDGAVLDPGKRIVFHREPFAASRAALTGDIWDERWRINGLRRGDRVAPLGVHANRFDWRGPGLRHLEAQALPAIHRDGRVIAPVLRPDNGLTAEPLRGRLYFRRLLLGH